MLTLLLKGALLGVTLSMIIGPLFFTVMQTALEKGRNAAFAVAAGIWSSDIVFVVAIQYGLGVIQGAVNNPKVIHALGLAGSVILLAFGLAGLLKRSDNVDFEEAGAVAQIRSGALWGFWVKGFMVNSINPGTLFFWIGIGAGMVAPNQWDMRQIGVFFGAMLLVLAITDTIKIQAARQLKQWLTPAHTEWVKKGIGVTLIAFGLFMAFNTLFRY